MRRAWQQCSDERGMALVMALFIMAILLAAGTVLVRMSATEGDIAYSTMWSEGSFFAADAAINVGLNQGVAPTNLTASAVTQATIGGSFTYQGNVTFSGTNHQPGFALGSGTGYNPGGFVFYNYAVTGSGTGPRSAQRTIDVVATYGPVAQ
jgi:hypothetical protein